MLMLHASWEELEECLDLQKNYCVNKCAQRKSEAYCANILFLLKKVDTFMQ
jgi:hypothetical protein